MSVSIDEGCCHSSSSEDEADHLTASSPRASPCPSSTPSSPLDMPSPFPSSPPALCSPCSYLPSTPPSSSGLEALDLASPCRSPHFDSVCGSGHVSPLLGPRSQCSGASSPDCDQERGVCVCVCSLHQCAFVCSLRIQSKLFIPHKANQVVSVVQFALL